MTGTGNTTTTTTTPTPTTTATTTTYTQKTHFRIYSTTQQQLPSTNNSSNQNSLLPSTDNQNPLEVFRQHYKKLLMHPVVKTSPTKTTEHKKNTRPPLPSNNNNNNNRGHHHQHFPETKDRPRKKVKLSRHKALYTDESSSNPSNSDVECAARKKPGFATVPKRRESVKEYADSCEDDADKGGKKPGRTKADGDTRSNTKENGYGKTSNDPSRSGGKTNGSTDKNTVAKPSSLVQRQNKKTTIATHREEEESPIKPGVRNVRRRVVESTSEEEEEEEEEVENGWNRHRLTKRKERRKVLQTKTSDIEDSTTRKPRVDTSARTEKKKSFRSVATSPPHQATTKRQTASSTTSSPSPTLSRPNGIQAKNASKKLSVAKKRSPKVAIDSERIVRASKSVRYGQFFKSAGDTSSNPLSVTLEYPGPNAKEKFLLLAPMMKSSTNQDVEDKAEYGPIRDIIRTIKTVAAYYLSSESRSEELFGNESEGLIRELIKSRNRREGAQFVAAVEEFNSILRQLKMNGELAKPFGTAKLYGEMGEVPYELVTHVLHQVYSRTVAPEADSLQQYKAFSNNVYGEVNPSLVKIFIEKTGVTRHSSFVDLGCGIGNVVLQVAAQTGCESYGIEIMEIPGNLALLQLQEFKARMWYYGLPHGRVKIWKGDFLTSPEIAQVLKGADVVFVNNYAFDQHLNHTLLQLFLDLKENVRIISLKSFVPENHKITSRNAGSVESILKVKKYPYYSDAVSWTNSGGDFYIHTVDRGPLRRFFEKSSLMGLGNGGGGVLDSYHRPSRSSARRAAEARSSSGGLFG